MSPVAPPPPARALRSSLYARIFLWFVPALLLTTMLSIFVGFVFRLEDTRHHRSMRRFARRMNEMTLEAVRVYDRDGLAALERFEDDNLPPMPDSFFRIHEAPGRDVHGREAPPFVREAVTEAFLKGRASMREGPPGERAERITAPSGKSYVVIQGFPRPPEPGGRLSFMLNIWFDRARKFRWPSILAVVMAGLLLCYGLALHLTRPIQSLREVAQRLAQGDLAVRIDPGLVKRTDELGDLARDFDTMARRIDELVRSRQRLFADISHELRSPLTRISVALELIRSAMAAAEEEGEGEGRSKGTGRAVERIERDVQRLDSLVGQLLTLTKLEDRMQARSGSEDFDLAVLVEEVVRDVSFEAGPQEVELRRGELAEAAFHGRRELLRRAVENVLRNAVSYTGEKGLVEWELRREGGRIVFRVRDHGPGVAREDLERIFEPFYRSDAARDRRAGGVGLGLAITRRAVELHEGRVEARLAEGGGLEVELSFPDEAAAGTA